MADTKIRVRNATAILKEDHQAVKKLFRRYEKGDDSEGSERMPLFQEIKTLLTIHTQIEEEFFYPAVGRVQVEQAGELVKEAREEHRIVSTLLNELSGLAPGDESFDAKMKVLQESVLHHAKEEERDIFPVFKKLDRAEQERVSQELDQRKRELSGGAA